MGRGREVDDSPGYYGHAVLKAPVWTWQIPVYFFLGGLAGGAAVIALAGLLTGAAPGMVLAALAAAMSGALLGPLLLIWDLQRPKRFLFMLRVFKPSSPMSVGAWILVAFGATTTAALAVYGLAEPMLAVVPRQSIGVVLLGAVIASATFGALLATYTGVLVGGTAVPVWKAHHLSLPLHFGAAGIGSAAGLLLLLGFVEEALMAVGLAAATVETLLAIAREGKRRSAVNAPTRQGRAGLALRASSALMGPSALVLFAAGLPRLAASLFLTGALLSRFGWLWAGQASARDPRATLVDAAPRETRSRSTSGRRAEPRGGRGAAPVPPLHPGAAPAAEGGRTF